MSPITIILVEPQMGENIGAAARVMANFGFDDLRIVNPRDGWPNKKAVAMAANSANIVTSATIYSSLSAALHDINLAIAVTARPRSSDKPSFTPRQLAETIAKPTIVNKKIALIFGSERTGLDNKQVAICDYIATIATAEANKSLNLAQAIAIFCYELSWLNLGVAASDPTDEANKHEVSNRASKKEIALLVERLLSDLDEHKFFKDDNRRQSLADNILSLFTRQNFTSQDIHSLHGIIRALSSDSSTNTSDAYIMIYTTTSSLEQAHMISAALVESKKAACVNIINDLHSVYEWEEKIEKSAEIALLIKTTHAREDDVYQLVKSLHTYEVPCLITINLHNVEKNFAKWLAKTLKCDI